MINVSTCRFRAHHVHRAVVELKTNIILFLASALINDDASKCSDDSGPTDEKKGIIRLYYSCFKKYV